jgi:hypothetical protein
MPSRRSAIIGIPAKGERPPLIDDWVLVDLFHVVKLEPLDAAPSPNGQSN